MRLKDIMTVDVATVTPGDSLREARTLMRLRGIHHLVVVDGRDVVGVVSDDLVRAGSAGDALFVRDVMDPVPLTATPDMPLADAAALLRGTALTVLPVLNERRQLVGIVTISDFLDLVGHVEAAGAAAAGRLGAQKGRGRPR